MQGHRDAQTKPERLATHLAELENQLRLSRSTPALRLSAPLAPGWSAARVRLSARVLGRLGRETGATGLRHLGEVLPALLDHLDVRDHRFAHLSDPMAHLETLLTQVLAGLDAGEPLAQWLADPAWDTVLARFAAAGTGLTVMSDLADRLQLWEAQYGGPARPAGQMAELGAGWSALRRMGDDLFAGPVARPDPPRPVGRPGGRIALLLVDSSFRRDQLDQKLRAMAFLTEILDGPRDLARRLAADPAPTVVLCDNLEPSHNLTRAADQLDDFPADRRPPLVLVTGGGDGGPRETLRARSLGGVGAWSDPYPPDRLAALLPC